MKTLSPSRPRISTYTLSPELLKTRAADLPELTSVTFEELFPDAPRPIPAKSRAEIRKVIRALTLQSLDQLDLSKIQPGDSVNILASSHGFTVYGGEAYVEMIRTIREEVKRRCGTDKIYLRAGVGLRFQENDEHIKHFGLDKDFTGKAEGITPVDRGVPIQTEIGTLYGVEKVYSARWLIHTHNNDIRELHYHRQIGRLFKPFAMSYATIETRFYSARIDPANGALVSLSVKPSGREMLGGPANVLVAEKHSGHGDPGDFVDARPKRQRLATSQDFKATVTATEGPLAITVEARGDFFGGGA
ncbi:MAG: hypothetical protein ABSF48_06780, partial [Thermodesulfobacteriota bacterium]